jgi:hypothetical protein
MRPRVLALALDSARALAFVPAAPGCEDLTVLELRCFDDADADAVRELHDLALESLLRDRQQQVQAS